MRHADLAAVSAFACSLVAALPADAQQSPLVDCWDGSFAYTMVGLRPHEAGYEVRIATQEETLFAPLFPDAALDWGQAHVSVVFPEAACVVDADQALFSCVADGVDLALDGRGLSSDEPFSASATVRAIVVEFTGVVRAGGGTAPTERHLTLNGLIDGHEATLGVVFDYPQYCDGSWSAFDER